MRFCRNQSVGNGVHSGPGSAMRFGWALSLFAIIVGVIFLALRSEMGLALLHQWSVVRSFEQNQGPYYRLKVRLTYKGEPQNFDIVVGCKVRRITYRDKSSTLEVGLIPTVFGRRMSDGRGLVIRPPRACEGETTSNGRIRSDLMPIVVLYEDASNLDFGTAYLSDDAYSNSVSVLKFGGATVEKATRTEFDTFNRTQTNVVTRESFWSAEAGDAVLNQMNIKRVPRPWAYMCTGYKRFKIQDDSRGLVQQYWPGTHPRYWIPDNDNEEKSYKQ
jgi:hypothetical protein